MTAYKQPSRMMPHYENGRFWNYPGETIKSVIIPSCAIYLKKLRSTKPYDVSQFSSWQQFDKNLTIEQTATQDEAHAPVAITWIGHASFLIKIGEFTLLTDPVFNDLTFLFPRFHAPGIALENLPTVDVVLISHNHRDHLEKSTLIHLAKKYNPLFLVPHGDKKVLHTWGITRVTDHTWWEASSYNVPQSPEKLVLTFLPTFHWSGRGLFDTNRSLWGSWMITHGSYNCYFAGDTAYGTHFQEIAREFPCIQTALMPIGPCEPNDHLKYSHINAEEAGEAFLTLNAQHFIPMHWGTFGFGIDRPLNPLHRMETWWHNTMLHQQPHNRSFVPLRIGQQMATVTKPAEQTLPGKFEEISEINL